MPLHPHIKSLFTPKTIAVISDTYLPGKMGYTILESLLLSKYSGQIFPINPSGDNILGLRSLSNILDLPRAVIPLDLAVISLPPKDVPQAMRQLVQFRVKSIIVTGSGFKEIGGDGALYEQEIKEIADKNTISLLGPNSLGFANPKNNINLTFVARQIIPGNIGFFSQSDTVCSGIFEWARLQGIGFSTFISIGNKAGIDESDILSYLADDPSTDVIIGYIENVNNGQRFLRYANIATRKKPVIILKAGKTFTGARVASAHTGAPPGFDVAYDVAFKQSGVIRVEKMEDLFTLAQAFSHQKLPKETGVGIVTNSGGLASITTDACIKENLSIATFFQETVSSLKKILPSYAALYNPVDITDDAEGSILATAAKIVIDDPAVHSLIVISAHTGQAPAHTTAKHLAEKLKNHEKPVLVCLMGGSEMEKICKIFASSKISCYNFPEIAVYAIATLYQQSQWKNSPMPVKVGYRRDVGRARKVINDAIANNETQLAEFQALELLRAYELPILESKLARTSEEAIQIAKNIGKPIALKIASPHIIYKRDIDGIALNLDSPEKIRKAFLDITGKAMRMRENAYIAGCLVQEMAPENSREVVLGVSRDKCFGPMVFFTIGGVHRETFKDISCRFAPISLSDSHDMVREIRAFPVLAGLQGQYPVKFTAIEDILLIMSELAVDFPEISDIRCDPVLVNEKEAVVVGIKVLLGKASTALDIKTFFD